MNREEAQNAFMNRHADIVIATNAFGMGIDRADVRFVAHFEIPGEVWRPIIRRPAEPDGLGSISSLSTTSV